MTHFSQPLRQEQFRQMRKYIDQYIRQLDSIIDYLDMQRWQTIHKAQIKREG